MDIREASARITALVEELKRLNECYYNENKEEIPNPVYDAKKKELEKLEADFPQLRRGDSPTGRVGVDRDSFFEKLPHRIPMLSLDNTYSYDEVREFDTRIREQLGFAPTYVCELKYDGMALALVYEKGHLQYAVTRGDGAEGDNVTNNILQITTIPHELPGVDFDVEVRGEVYMLNSYFEEQEADPTRKLKLKTPRNATSGTVKSHDPSKVAERRLQFVGYQYYGTPLAKTHFETIDQLQAWGIPTGALRARCKDIDEVLATIEAWKTLRQSQDYDTDGAVVKVDDLELRAKLGATAHAPRWAIAYKYPPERKETRLKNVRFQVGRSGIITPVAELETVKLNHADISNATLHNAEQLVRLDLHEHDMVLIERAGEVIPKIVGVNPSKREPWAKPVTYPTCCPSCGTPLQQREGQVYYFCPNHAGCMAQHIAQTIYFVSRPALDIRSVAEKKIEEWYRNGLLHAPLDLYALTLERLESYKRSQFKESDYDGVLNGERVLKRQAALSLKLYIASSEKLLEQIALSTHRPVEALLVGLGVPNLGEVQSEVLLAHFGSLERLASATVEEMSEIPGVGAIVAVDVWDYFHSPANEALIPHLRALGFDLTYHPHVALSDSLEGEFVVVTGKFSQVGSRPEVVKRIKEMGATVQSSIGGTTTLLIAGVRPNDKKLKQAHERGIRILTEEEFSDLLGD